MLLPVLFLLQCMALAAVALTCYNCQGNACETGRCNGTYCVDKYTDNSKVGTRSYIRGCYDELAGFTTEELKDGTGCDVQVLDKLLISTCVCQSDFCNKGPFRKGTLGGGKHTCALGTQGNIYGTCKGDSCRYAEKNLGIGCENNEGFLDRVYYNPPPGFNGCYKRRNSDGKESQEQCVCASDNCNRNADGAKYHRPLVTCKDTSDYDPTIRSCIGNACFITGIDLPPPLNGYIRGCLMITGEKKNAARIPAFCKDSYTGGNSFPERTCLCTSSNCNVDVDTAVASIPKASVSATPSLLLMSVAATILSIETRAMLLNG